jgi:hypothetical protein
MSGSTKDKVKCFGLLKEGVRSLLEWLLGRAGFEKK